MRKVLGRCLLVVLLILSVLGVAGMTVNNHVVGKAKSQIACAVTEDKPQLTQEEIRQLQALDADCILILGAGVKDDGTPSPMLRDRLEVGIALYKAGAAPKVLLSGDNGQKTYNEIGVMLQYAEDAGVPDADIFCDHAGFSTYDSLYRAQQIFAAERILVVTQTYHEYRALYIGEKLGLSVWGVAADQQTYAGQPLREVREVLARVKDVIKVAAGSEATLGGDPFPISGNGEATHGE